MSKATSNSGRKMVEAFAKNLKHVEPVAVAGGSVNTWKLTFTVAGDATVHERTMTLDAHNLGLVTAAVTVVSLELVA